jgi:Ca2+-binding EF-hand superfamily protein
MFSDSGCWQNSPLSCIVSMLTPFPLAWLLLFQVFSVYVSSSITENEKERLCLSREVAKMVRDAVVCFGFEFEFVDPYLSLWNAPELAHDFDYRHKCHNVMQQCQAESAGIDFLFLIGQEDNGISFPGTVDFEVFSSVIKCIPDRGELGKLRKVVIDWYKLDTNSNPRKYVMLDRRKKIPNLSSIDTKKKAIGQQEWLRLYSELQKGFYEATKIQIRALKMQKIRTGILGKLGKVDSYSMKKKAYELFAQIDVDGSDQIDVEELQIAFEQLDVKLTTEETREFMDEFDEDKSGEIGFDEFLLIIEKLLLDAVIQVNVLLHLCDRRTRISVLSSL